MAGGDFGAGGDFRSKPDNAVDDQGDENSLDPKSRAYVRSLLAEKLKIDSEKNPLAIRLLDEEIARTQAEGRPGKFDSKFVNVYRAKPVKVVCKVLVPLKEHPKFNFVGKLLGPKGNTFKSLQEETLCRMAILGRGSMKDRQKEEELRKSLELKYAHLADDLHVEISVIAPPAEAYARIAFALTELRKYLIPDGADEISQGQFREMEVFEDRPFGPKGRPGPGPGPMRRPLLRGPPGKPPGPPLRAGGRPPMGPPRGIPGKSKVLSILDRARSAMEDSYGDQFDEPYEPESIYEDYPPSGPSRSGFAGGNRFSGGSDYDADFYGDNSNNYGDNQRWKSYKPGGAAPRSEETRYRPTPYSRGGK